MPLDTVTFFDSITAMMTTFRSVAGFFMEAPVVYFVGLAFIAACVGTWKKLIPSKKK